MVQRAIQVNPKEFDDGDKAAAAFEGFDANNEGEYYKSARFILHDLKKYRDLRVIDLDSHCHTLRRYHQMVEAFQSLDRDGALTPEQAKTVLAALRAVAES